MCHPATLGQKLLWLKANGAPSGSKALPRICFLVLNTARPPRLETDSSSHCCVEALEPFKARWFPVPYIITNLPGAPRFVPVSQYPLGPCAHSILYVQTPSDDVRFDQAITARVPTLWTGSPGSFSLFSRSHPGISSSSWDIETRDASTHDAVPSRRV